MRKKEHIHIHALLAEVTRHLLENGQLSADRLAAYDALGTRPSNVHDSKRDHREAIMTLGAAIELCLDRTPTESHDHPVNR
jgi:hypothetical protein